MGHTEVFIMRHWPHNGPVALTDGVEVPARDQDLFLHHRSAVTDRLEFARGTKRKERGFQEDGGKETKRGWVKCCGVKRGEGV